MKSVQFPIRLKEAKHMDDLSVIVDAKGRKIYECNDFDHQQADMLVALFNALAGAAKRSQR